MTCCEIEDLVHRGRVFSLTFPGATAADEWDRHHHWEASHADFPRQAMVSTNALSSSASTSCGTERSSASSLPTGRSNDRPSARTSR